MLRKFAMLVATLTASVSLLGAASASEKHTKAFDEIVFEEGVEGVSFGLVWGDWNKGPYSMIVRIKAGYAAPLHRHSTAYHGIAIQGNWVHTTIDGTEHVITPGSYSYQAADENHGDRCRGPEDCLILIHMQGPRDFILADDK